MTGEQAYQEWDSILKLFDTRSSVLKFGDDKLLVLKTAEEIFDELNLCLKYTLFDLEVTRREKTYLQKQLKEAQHN